MKMVAMESSQQGASEVLVLADAAAWRAWLDSNEDVSDGVWLLMAKKGKKSATSLMIADALDEALCSGWIDGQRRAHDDATFLQRFTPRRARSIWSQRNVEYVARLIEQGRMRPRGQAEIDRAKADGRWDRAYAGPATAEVPDDLIAALRARPAAQERFDALNSRDRFLVLFQLMTASSQATRARRLKRIVEKLADEAAPGS